MLLAYVSGPLLATLEANDDLVNVTGFFRLEPERALFFCGLG